MNHATESDACPWREEFLAGLNSAVYFDVSSRDELTLTGRDRHAFLHGFCTNEIKNLPVGNSCEAFATNIKGKVLAHVFVFAETGRLILDSVPGANEVLVPHLDRYLITEDVQLLPTTQQRRLFFLTGPEVLRMLGRITPTAETLAPGTSRAISMDNQTVHARRVDWMKEQGILLSTEIRGAEGIVQCLQSAGAIPGSPPAWHALRIRARFPLFGTDFTEETLAQEVDRTADAISFRTGCYLGQEPIARIDALGHVNRLLRSVELRNPDPAMGDFTGAEIVSTPDGQKEIGTVTSFAWLPEEAKPRGVGLAMLRREFSATGQTVYLRLPSGYREANVF